MVKQVRNTEEIVRLAKQKSRRTRENVDKVISKLSLEGKTINFNTVARKLMFLNHGFIRNMILGKGLNLSKTAKQKM